MTNQTKVWGFFCAKQNSWFAHIFILIHYTVYGIGSSPIQVNILYIIETTKVAGKHPCKGDMKQRQWVIPALYLSNEYLFTKWPLSKNRLYSHKRINNTWVFTWLFELLRWYYIIPILSVSSMFRCWTAEQMFLICCYFFRVLADSCPLLLPCFVLPLAGLWHPPHHGWLCAGQPAVMDTFWHSHLA